MLTCQVPDYSTGLDQKKTECNYKFISLVYQQFLSNNKSLSSFVHFDMKSHLLNALRVSFVSCTCSSLQ